MALETVGVFGRKALAFLAAIAGIAIEHILQWILRNGHKALDVEILSALITHNIVVDGSSRDGRSRYHKTARCRRCRARDSRSRAVS